MTDGMDMERDRAASGATGAYDRDGFEVVRGLLAPAEVAEVRRAIDDLYDRFETLPEGHGYDLAAKAGRGERGAIPAIRNVLRLRPDLAGAIESACLPRARRYLGRRPLVVWDAAVYMPPGNPDVDSAWHQDAYFSTIASRREPGRYGYFWLALDDVDDRGGGIRFVPGSHVGPLLPHRWRGGDPNSGLEVSSPVDGSLACTPSLRAGDATFHHPRTLHGAGPNLTDRCRKAWVIGVEAPLLPPWLLRARRAARGRIRALRAGGLSGGASAQSFQSQDPTSPRRSWRVMSKWSGVTVM